jgi:hypothetical protein
MQLKIEKKNKLLEIFILAKHKHLKNIFNYFREAHLLNTILEKLTLECN